MIWAARPTKIYNITYFKKENSIANISNKKYNQIKMRIIFNYSIFKVNKDKLPLARKYKITLIIWIMGKNKCSFQ